MPASRFVTTGYRKQYSDLVRNKMLSRLYGESPRSCPPDSVLKAQRSEKNLATATSNRDHIPANPRVPGAGFITLAGIRGDP